MFAKQAFSVCLIQPPGYVHSRGLMEVCEMLRLSLQDLGFDCDLQIEGLHTDRTNIIVGWHLLEPSAKPKILGINMSSMIFYQLEQLSDREGWWTLGREMVLLQAGSIWDYAPENVAFLDAEGFR